MKQDIRDAWRAVRASATPDVAAYQQVGDALCEELSTALHRLVDDAETLDRGIAMGARLGTALRMVDELQADNTRLLEERRAAVAEVKLRVREIEKLRDKLKLRNEGEA